MSPIVNQVILLVYPNIWKLKEIICRRNRKGLLYNAYTYYFARLDSWIGVRSKFLGVPCFPHGCRGIFISNNAVIGKNAVIFHQVTIGSNTLSDSKNFGSPVLGDNVYIGAGAKIIGGVTIGDNCRIGANAVVTEDMTPNSVAVQSPTRIINKSGSLDNRFYSQRHDGSWVYFLNGNWVKAEKDFRGYENPNDRP